MYNISSKFNSTFATSGKATADKVDPKSRRETQAFASIMQRSTSETFWTVFGFS